MTRDQKIVAMGSAGGVLTMVVAVIAIFWLWPINPSLSDIPMRLGYAIQANAFALVPLLLGILAVANARFLTDAIDPTLQKENRAMQINGRVVDNTLQQFVLFLVASTALSVNATSSQMRLIPPQQLYLFSLVWPSGSGTAFIRSTERSAWERPDTSMWDFLPLRFGRR